MYTEEEAQDFVEGPAEKAVETPSGNATITQTSADSSNDTISNAMKGMNKRKSTTPKKEEPEEAEVIEEKPATEKGEPTVYDRLQKAPEPPRDEDGMRKVWDILADYPQYNQDNLRKAWKGLGKGEISKEDLCRRGKAETIIELVKIVDGY